MSAKLRLTSYVIAEQEVPYRFVILYIYITYRQHKTIHKEEKLEKA